MFCPHCGASVEAGAYSCSSCGGQIAEANQGGVGVAAPPVVQGMVVGPVPHYLVWSILVTIFCCQPAGIVGIVFSAIAMSKNGSADYDGAARAAQTAKMWNWIGFGIGIAGMLAYAGFVILAMAAGAASTP